jgi:hypothetical protein
MTEFKQVAHKKIQVLVYLHAVHVKNVTGFEINQEREQKRLYNDWVAGLITLEAIQDDINEYLKMKKCD